MTRQKVTLSDYFNNLTEANSNLGLSKKISDASKERDAVAEVSEMTNESIKNTIVRLMSSIDGVETFEKDVERIKIGGKCGTNLMFMHKFQDDSAIGLFIKAGEIVKKAYLTTQLLIIKSTAGTKFLYFSSENVDRKNLVPSGVIPIWNPTKGKASLYSEDQEFLSQLSSIRCLNASEAHNEFPFAYADESTNWQQWWIRENIDLVAEDIEKLKKVFIAAIKSREYQIMLNQTIEDNFVIVR